MCYFVNRKQVKIGQANKYVAFCGRLWFISIILQISKPYILKFPDNLSIIFRYTCAWSTYYIILSVYNFDLIQVISLWKCQHCKNWFSFIAWQACATFEIMKSWNLTWNHSIISSFSNGLIIEVLKSDLVLLFYKKQYSNKKK